MYIETGSMDKQPFCAILLLTFGNMYIVLNLLLLNETQCAYYLPQENVVNEFADVL